MIFVNLRTVILFFWGLLMAMATLRIPEPTWSMYDCTDYNPAGSFTVTVSTFTCWLRPPVQLHW